MSLKRDGERGDDLQPLRKVRGEDGAHLVSRRTNMSRQSDGFFWPIPGTCQPTPGAICVAFLTALFRRTRLDGSTGI
jgi:hypothetical protein